jgi:hypothetical protein
MPAIQPYASHVAAVLVSTLLPTSILGAQQASENIQTRRAALELQKLELEIANLKSQAVPSWLFGVLGLLVGIAGTATSLLVARHARFGALDQSVHDQRLKTYPNLVKATAPLALYFPAYRSAEGTLEPEECSEIGKAISQWYFIEGGLLLSEESRHAYFKLARALTRASLARNLSVPRFPGDAEEISAEKVDEYRRRLPSRLDLNDVERWSFGATASQALSPEARFKDYILLQSLSSSLRTSLSEDLRSRRRPST